MVRPRFAVVFALSALLVLAFAGPASAQPQQKGLVNVNVSDVVIQVPIAVAANICGVSVNALAQDIRIGDADCDATAQSGATIEWPPGNGKGPQQQGLVNVNVSDVIVQLPIGIAANVCGVDANVLAADIRTGDAECDAISVAEAG